MSSEDEKQKALAAKRLKELTVSRSSIKGQITKFKIYINTLNTKEEISNIELAELSLKLSKLEGLSSKFDTLQNEIEVLNADQLSTELDEREMIEQNIITNIAKAKTLIEKYSAIEMERRNSVAVPVPAQCTHDHQDQGFKLPQIQISKFDGAYFRWLEFRDTFENLIHKNERIKPIHKFHYLISYLEGDAARIISNLEVSSANYEEAWKLLGDRYNNKRLLVNHHLSSLFNIQAPARESEKALRFLVDHVTKNLRALSSLGQPTDKWDMLVIFMLTSKLDSQTLMKWEEYRNTLDDVPTLDQFHKFLINRADVLEALNRNKHETGNSKFLPSTSRPSPPAPNHQNNSYNNNKIKSFAGVYQKSKPNFKQNTYTPGTAVCIICSDNHRIYDCPTFAAKSIKDKLADVANYKLCANCLRQGHPVSECRGGPCRDCNQRHNSLLHEPSRTSPGIISSAATVSNASSAANFFDLDNNRGLLSTAIIEVCNPKTNQKERVRAFLDNGSEFSFIKQSLKERLSLQSNPIDCINLIGAGNKCVDNIVERCTTQIHSLHNPYKLALSCFVLKELTGNIRERPVDVQSLQIPKHIRLADPDFNQPGEIEILIGADIFWDILGTKKLSLGPSMPTLRDSKFGWLICGRMYTNTNNQNNKNQNTNDTNNKIQNKINCNHAIISKSQQNIENMLTKFWETEEVPNKNALNQNEQECENHFLTNTIRLDNGRFCVKLPLTESPECLGDSYNLAKRRFLNLERKFKRNPTLKSEYTTFINEYAELGHLSESSLLKPNPNYFLCHHAVFKNSESTSLRVVYDASAASSSGKSLNDILLVGPNVQDSLFSILVRARQYRYILSGDIEKMYRQVQVHDDDRNLQLIVWREDESSPLKTLRLNTLTYGTGSASYLSTRCLFQVGEEQSDQLIKTIIQKDFYVDDLITGANSEYELKYIQKSVSEALKTGCFNLRKYKSNLSSLFEDANINTQENLIISESASTLGLGWSPVNDTLNFPVKDPIPSDVITKRYIMSNAFKIFDPLGCLSLCIIKPKMLLQKLWELKIDWDLPVPDYIKKEWEKFVENIPFIQNLKIDRRVLCDSPKLIEMHVFSDASQSALGACIYMKSLSENGDVIVRLLCSKSKVAQLSPTTMPRQELGAALLAARLSRAVLDSLRYKPDRVVHWCDSSIVLSWLHNKSAKLKVFVANRINEILEKTKESTWRYVPTSANPADLISRGVDACQLPKLDLWWFGPTFLTEDESKWPVLNNLKIDDLPETKCNVVNLETPIVDFEKYSTLNKLQRSFAYVKRMIFNLKNPKNKRVGVLTVDELTESFKFLCLIAQKQSFQDEYEMLTKSKPLSSKSKILKLSPFLDNDKVIRVGGRIDASDYPYEKKHQILLHASHRLSKLIFANVHIKHMHAPPQLLLSLVKETVWPINGRRLAQRTVNNCMRCRRARGKTLTPKMGNLPAQRINADFPFISVGLDFAGPFYILNRKGRGAKLIKCYLCLFVCLRYKCLHLEAVSDLTKNAFIMTLRRFIARRGKPAEIFCDNGRNFVSAAKEIGQFIKANQEPMSDFANQEYIKFIFTPTYAPHFGGIWEAGVKSAKHHIKRVIGNSHLTFEEIGTLFAQVEAILNSRPLCPMSTSPDDLLSLSPGHFLIGRPLTALPSPALENRQEMSLQRYARIEKIRQHFWNRWQREYISELQERTKWRTNTAKLNLGDLVLLHEDHVPPLCWRLGRVTRLFPGADGVARVADVTTTKGCVRRPLVRLCPLPSPEDLKF
ncbi:uncharacterized protein LOC134660793 [Cydia amplana]|uniref:uncharacterized protein LOC134660793 n=3 Tax=Cydia amplana TaxID=1869771 RepID=UPI002FE51E6D